MLKAMLLSAGVQVHTPPHVSPHPGHEAKPSPLQVPGDRQLPHPRVGAGTAEVGTQWLPPHLTTVSLKEMRMPLARLVLEENIYKVIAFPLPQPDFLFLFGTFFCFGLVFWIIFILAMCLEGERKGAIFFLYIIF